MASSQSLKPYSLEVPLVYEYSALIKLMIYCLISTVARTCCLFHYLEAVEVGSGFAASCHHCCEVWFYVYFHFKPIPYIWKELLCYCCLCTFIPFFLLFFTDSFFNFTYQRPLGDRSVPVSCCCFGS
jgi:hypothetical protein